jgi:hypothetical protein
MSNRTQVEHETDCAIKTHYNSMNSWNDRYHSVKYPFTTREYDGNDTFNADDSTQQWREFINSAPVSTVRGRLRPYFYYGNVDAIAPFEVQIQWEILQYQF